MRSTKSISFKFNDSWLLIDFYKHEIIYIIKCYNILLSYRSVCSSIVVIYFNFLYDYIYCCAESNLNWKFSEGILLFVWCSCCVGNLLIDIFVNCYVNRLKCFVVGMCWTRCFKYPSVKLRVWRMTDRNVRIRAIGSQLCPNHKSGHLLSDLQI